MLHFAECSRGSRWGSAPRRPEGALQPPLTHSDWQDSVGERRILWIDDDYPPSRGLTRVLGMEGFVLDYVQTGRAGLGFAVARSYAAIALDLRLPDISGLTVLEQLRAEGIHAPTVVITGFSDSATEREAMHAGAAGFREKSAADDLAELLLSVAGVSMSGSDASRHSTISTIRRPTQRIRTLA